MLALVGKVKKVTNTFVYYQHKEGKYNIVPNALN